MLKMAQELGKHLTITGILPSFKILASDNDSIKIALIEQVNSIASFLIDKKESDEYHHCLGVIVPILNEFLYDKNDQVKKKAVKALVEFWDKLTPNDRGDYILKFMLELAHEEDDEKARVTALQILNKVAGKLDVELWEKFIVKEIKSLAIDPFPLVRKNVASNLNNVWKSITRDWFLQEIFPLLQHLGEDKEDEVRNSWVEQVSRISSVCPPTIRTGQLEQLYITFMQDKSKKVKMNSFKYLGKFLETLKDLEITNDFLELYTETGLQTKNKDILFHCAYNIPGILYILKSDSWEALEELYFKMTKSPDPRIKKTLAHSLHEIAKIIGREKTEELLIDILHQYLRDGLKEVRAGIISHLHEFWGVISSKERTQFLKVYCDGLHDKDMIDIFAENIGDFSLLFSPEDVTKHLLPLFFKLSESRTAFVRKLASQNLAKILKVYEKDGKEKQEEIIRRVNKEFCLSTMFFQRQAFIYMAASVMNSNKELFERHLKTNFCSLARDRVCNVRIVLAKALADHIKGEGQLYFDLEVNKALYILKQDREKNVTEQTEGITVVVNTDTIKKLLQDESTNQSNLFEEESKSNPCDSSNQESEENLIDVADDPKSPQADVLQELTEVFTNKLEASKSPEKALAEVIQEANEVEPIKTEEEKENNEESKSSPEGESEPKEASFVQPEEDQSVATNVDTSEVPKVNEEVKQEIPEDSAPPAESKVNNVSIENGNEEKSEVKMETQPESSTGTDNQQQK